MIYKYFLPFHRLPFHVVDGFLFYVENFYFDVVELGFFFFFFCTFTFGAKSEKILSRLMSRSLLLVFSSRRFMVSGLTFMS